MANRGIGSGGSGAAGYSLPRMTKDDKISDLNAIIADLRASLADRNAEVQALKERLEWVWENECGCL